MSKQIFFIRASEMLPWQDFIGVEVEVVFRSYISKQKNVAFAYCNSYVNHPAFYSIHAVYCTVLTAQEDNNSDNVWEVCDCCEKTTNFTNDPFYRCELVRRISWDFDKLQYHGWDDNTPIKPDVFDQLWDEGKEPDWDEVAENMKVKMEDTG